MIGTLEERVRQEITCAPAFDAPVTLTRDEVAELLDLPEKLAEKVRTQEETLLGAWCMLCDWIEEGGGPMRRLNRTTADGRHPCYWTREEAAEHLDWRGAALWRLLNQATEDI